MKNLELLTYLAVDLTVKEMQEIKGGGIKDLFFGAVSAIVDFGNGVIDGYENARIQRVIDSSPSYA